MAPKKKEVQKLSYGEFMTNDTFGGSWADEVEETYESGTQPLPPSERRTFGGASYGGDRGYSHRESLPQRIPDKPPYLAHLGNLDYEVKSEDIDQLLEGCEVVSVRLIEDRELKRPKGFGYAEFATVDGLKKALALDGVSFQGRNIKIKIADPPKDRDRGESTRDFSDWTRKGPLPDLPNRSADRRPGGPPEFGERRPPREAPQDDKVRDFGNWERKGPLSPLPQPEAPAMSREGSRPRANEGRSESIRGARRASPASWGEGRQDGSRPPRRDREFPERPERVPTAADRDMQWRNNMRPDAAAKSPTQSRSGSEAPPSPAPAAAVPAMRPKLNLAKRTVSDAPDVTSPALTSAGGDSKASPFGAARPIDTAAKEREIAEKREAALREKKESEERSKEERRLAREAAAEAASDKATSEAPPAADELPAEGSGSAKDQDEVPDDHEAEQEEGGGQDDVQNGGTPTEETTTSRPREPRENVQNFKSRATDSGNWRQPSGEQRGPRGPVPSGPRRGGGPPRGPRHDGPRPPRSNGGPAPPVHQAQPPQQTADAEPTGPDEDGWERVPNKGRRNQRTRPLA